MEEPRRVTTVKKPKKTTTILLAFIGILGIALIAVAVYFYVSGEDTGEEKKTEKTCACYFIDPEVIPECGDPRRGFIFNIAKTTSDQTCKATCSNSSLTTNLLNSNTQQSLYKSCPLNNIQDTRCYEMTIKDSDGKIVTGKIASDEKITVEAKFDKEYTDYQIVVNNEPLQPDTISADKLTIKKELSDFTKTSLNIIATATTATGDTINSPICRRLIDVEQPSSSSVNNLMVTTSSDTGVFRLTGMTISVGNIPEEDKLEITFSFDTKKHQNITMTKGFTLNSSKGEISILGQDLYNQTNFADGVTFSQLDGYEGDVTITASITDITKNQEIGKTSKVVTYIQPEVQQTPQEEQESDFQVTNNANLSCVERVEPTNKVEITITIVNNSSSAQTINSIKNKLPLGFIYSENTTKINGALVKDADYLTDTTIGDTHELVWSKTQGWTLSPTQSLIIVFTAQAGPNALTGNNQNEVIITPQQIPVDPSQLRAESIILVAQDCSNPEASIPQPSEPSGNQPQTGIFDSSIIRIFIGFIILILGWFILNRPFGRVVAKKLTDSDIYKNAEMTSLRIFEPKKYFEKKTIKKISKRD